MAIVLVSVCTFTSLAVAVAATVHRVNALSDVGAAGVIRREGQICTCFVPHLLCCPGLSTSR
jgi:hypothetical protein